MTTRNLVVFLSPHLDDAVLSCAGAIRHHVVLGDRVVVATVFSDGANASLRRDEDHAAVASLGAEAVHLGLLDAPERLGIARSHRALVEDADVREADVAAVRHAIHADVHGVHDARIYAPLGVGEHVDHRVVHAASCELPGAVFYEDRPYAFLAGAVRARLLALGLRAEGAGTADLGAPPDRAIVEAQLEALPFVRAFLADDDRGARARGWLTARLTARAAASMASIRADVAAYDEQTARAAARAIGLYASQAEALFGGPQLVAPALREAARTIDADAASSPHAERIFRRRG